MADVTVAVRRRDECLMWCFLRLTVMLPVEKMFPLVRFVEHGGRHGGYRARDGSSPFSL